MFTARFRTVNHARSTKSMGPEPSFIPTPIIEDYTEACRISLLSPKASATLSRRCLQGMIRDFCGIKEKNLFNEIEKLKEMAKNGSAPRGVSLGSGLVLSQSQKITVAASAIAEKKVFGHRS
ncbi:DUF4145 domain-containing protein [Sagittula stellata]|uniref:DUF4145 domain-containing protein n=1 Tax=Sagittula stellata TaxID=52603 RepID=UPI000A04CCE5